MTRILMVRHGQTNYNVYGCYQGQLDTPLNELGAAQAKELKKRILESGLHIDEIWSSDLQRTRATVAPIAEALSIPLHLHAGLREINVGYFTDKTHEEVEEMFPNELAEMRQKGQYAAYPGGEELKDARKRIRQAVTDIAEKNDGRTVLLASHGGSIHQLIVDIYIRLGAKLPAVSLPNCALLTFEYDNGDITLRSMEKENGEEIFFSDEEKEKDAIL